MNVKRMESNNNPVHEGTKKKGRRRQKSSLPMSHPRPPWWNRRTRMERTLCTTTMVFFMACIALALVLAVVTVDVNNSVGKIETSVNVPDAERFTASSSNCENAGCQSRGCVKAASHIKQMVLQTIIGLANFEFVQARFIDKGHKLLGVTKNKLEGTCCKSEPLMTLLEDLGGYPVLQESWSDSNFDWMNILFKMRELGYDHDILADLSVITDPRNSTVHIIDLDQTDLGLPDRSYYIRGMNDSIVQAYFKMMVESVVLLGGDKQRATTEMMDISLPKEERRNITRLYNKMTVEDLKNLAPGVDWLKLLKNLIRDDVTNDEYIIVDVPDFVKNLDELLQTVNKRTLANYLMWRITLQSFTGLDKRFKDLVQDFRETLIGTKKTSSSMEAIKNDWMDEETKKQALDKANSIISFIGFPEELLDDQKLIDYCMPLSIDRNDFFKNIRATYKFSVDYAFNKLREPVDKLNWIKNSRAAVVNAFYSALVNSICCAHIGHLEELCVRSGSMHSLMDERSCINSLNYWCRRCSFTAFFGQLVCLFEVLNTNIR
ncbi:Neprilysin-2 [Nymphon striatum]|nr:Neprilysin-2 [Nymphon striatum]